MLCNRRCCNAMRSKLCGTLSKACWKSKLMMSYGLRSLMRLAISESHDSKFDTVDRPALNPCWQEDNRHTFSICCCNCSLTIFSNTFPKHGRYRPIGGSCCLLSFALIQGIYVGWLPCSWEGSLCK